MKTPKLLIISGATASGKTDLAIELALQLKTEIISCDARQFYKELNIGVAKPTAKQLHSVPHHFISHISINEKYTIADFERDSLELLDNLFQKQEIVILCGGSGLYIDALCNGIDEMPEISDEIKNQVSLLSKEACLDIIKEKDPSYFQKLDKENSRRIQRATEVILASGLAFSHFRKETAKNRNFDIVKYAIDIDRETLYQRINNRVDLMIEAGLEEEAQSLYSYLPNKNLDTIGYTEFFDFIEKKMSKAEAIDKIKQHTRNYAKRQITWFKKDKSIVWIDKNDVVKILNDLKA